MSPLTMIKLILNTPPGVLHKTSFSTWKPDHRQSNFPSTPSSQYEFPSAQKTTSLSTLPGIENQEIKEEPFGPIQTTQKNSGAQDTTSTTQQSKDSISDKSNSSLSTDDTAGTCSQKISRANHIGLLLLTNASKSKTMQD